MDPLLRLESEVHVWMVSPDEIADPGILDRYVSLLSPDERERHRRFHFEKDRHAFLVSHALVRTVLSRYADIKPEDWQFSLGEQGRPEIVAGTDLPPLRFNLTHTQGLAACVVTQDIACGIDAEKITARGSPQAIADKMFAAIELEDLKGLSETAWLDRFYVYWTLREAYCKALGVGLTQSDNSYAFVTDDAGRYRLSVDATPGGEAYGWCFDVSRPTGDHIVSVAYPSGTVPARTVVAGTMVPLLNPD